MTFPRLLLLATAATLWQEPLASAPPSPEAPTAEFKPAGYFGAPDHSKTLEQIDREDRPYPGQHTWTDYENLLEELSKERYLVVPLAEFPSTRSTDKVVVGLRHDSDSHPLKALQMAKREKTAAIRSSYFLLHTAKYYGAVRDGLMRRNGAIDGLARRLHAMGFEVGIHHDLFNIMWKYHFDPRAFMQEEVAYYRGLGIPVTGTAAHGDQTTIKRKLNERWMFSEFGRSGAFVWEGKSYPYGKYPLAEFGVDYEAYLLKSDAYLSDVGKATASELIEKISQLPPGKRCTILIHPERWGRPE